MGNITAISWTEHTFNGWWGCSKVSPGCTKCYAESLSNRVGKDVWGKGKERWRTSAANWKEPLKYPLISAFLIFYARAEPDILW